MGIKENQQRLKSLITDTITMLCKNSVVYKEEFSIEALIGITLDQEDIVLVNIKEIVKNATKSKATVDFDTSPTKTDSKSRKRKKNRKTSHDDTHSDFSDTANCSDIYDNDEGVSSSKMSRQSYELDGDYISEVNNVTVKKENDEDDDDDDDEIVFVKDEPKSPLQIPTFQDERMGFSYDNNLIQNTQPQHISGGITMTSVPNNPHVEQSMLYTVNSVSTPAQNSTHSGKQWRASYQGTNNKTTQQLQDTSHNQPSNVVAFPLAGNLIDDTGTKFICGVCGKEFAQYSGLCRHRSTIHNTPKCHICPVCQKNYNRRDNLTKHLKLIHKMDPGSAS